MIIPVRAAIITASDRSFARKREDKSGPLLKALLEEWGAEVIAYQVLPDDRDALKKTFCLIADRFSCDLILTTGGTGLSPRDQTPEATRDVIQKEVPGIPELLRYESLKKTKFATLSRGVAGIRGKTLMINFPGSPKAAQEAFEALKDILHHAIELIRGEVKDCRPLLRSLS